MAYTLVAITAFLGIIVGMLLAFIAPEELRPGRKYFLLYQNTLAVILFTLFLSFHTQSFWKPVIWNIPFILFLYYIHENRFDFELHRLLFVLSAAVLYLSRHVKELFLIEAALIFLYGMPIASLFVEQQFMWSKAKQFGELMKNYGFFIVLAVLLVVFT